MRPIQWQLKKHWRTLEVLSKLILVPKELHPHLLWWLEEENVLTGQSLHPLEHFLQMFTDASGEGWGAHLNDHTARGSCSVPESKFHINLLELKAVFVALKEFQPLCKGRVVLIANRQYHRCCIHKQTGRHEVRPSLHPIMANIVVVHQPPGDHQGKTYPRSPQCQS